MSELERVMVEYVPKRRPDLVKSKPPVEPVSHDEGVMEEPSIEAAPTPPAYTGSPTYQTLVSRWKAPEDAWQKVGEAPEGERVEPFLIRRFREEFGVEK